MKKARKTLIIEEIRYWKKNKLLPDRYCDFLLALYTQGNQEEQRESKEPAITIKEMFVLFLEIILLLILIFFMLYRQNVVIQLTAMTASILVSIVVLYRFNSRKPALYLAVLILVCTCFLFLLGQG